MKSILFIFCLLCWSQLPAQIVLTSDVGATLSGTPTTNLLTGQPVNLTLTVTNYGPDPVSILQVSSSTWVNEINLLSFNSAECFLVVSVLDGATPAYYMSWIVAGLPGQPAFAPGETHTCHLSIALTSAAPASTTFSFGLPDFITDTNPRNDRGAVVLTRAPAAIATAVPALSWAAMLFLALAIVLVAQHTGARYRIGASINGTRPAPRI